MIDTAALVETVVRTCAGLPVVFTTGYTCRFAHAVADTPNHLYLVGSMGMAPVLAAGIAGQTTRTVVVLDGDGALLMNPGALLMIAAHRPANLLHVVADNGCYRSTGGQPTGSEAVDLPTIALACGYPRATTITAPAGLAARLPALVRAPRGPHLVLVRTTGGTAVPGRVVIPPEQNYRRFRAWFRGSAPLEEKGRTCTAN